MPCATPCKNCDRKGLPILFVRYAAAYSAQAKGMDALKPLQPKGQLQAPPGGIAMQTARYNVRMLRAGYLYLRIERKGVSPEWQGYIVHPHGYLGEFPVALPQAAASHPACEMEFRGANSSMVWVGDAKNVTKLDYTFHPDPIDYEHLKKEIEPNLGKYMQGFDVAGWAGGSTSQKDTLQPGQLDGQVVEFAALSTADVRDVGNEQHFGLMGCTPLEREWGTYLEERNGRHFGETAGGAATGPAKGPYIATIRQPEYSEKHGPRLERIRKFLMLHKGAVVACEDAIGIAQELSMHHLTAAIPYVDWLQETDAQGVSNQWKQAASESVRTIRLALQKSTMTAYDDQTGNLRRVDENMADHYPGSDSLQPVRLRRADGSYEEISVKELNRRRREELQDRIGARESDRSLASKGATEEALKKTDALCDAAAMADFDKLHKSKLEERDALMDKIATDLQFWLRADNLTDKALGRYNENADLARSDDGLRCTGQLCAILLQIDSAPKGRQWYAALDAFTPGKKNLVWRMLSFNNTAISNELQKALANLTDPLPPAGMEIRSAEDNARTQKAYGAMAVALGQISKTLSAADKIGKELGTMNDGGAGTAARLGAAFQIAKAAQDSPVSVLLVSAVARFKALPIAKAESMLARSQALALAHGLGQQSIAFVKNEHAEALSKSAAKQARYFQRRIERELKSGGANGAAQGMRMTNVLCTINAIAILPAFGKAYARNDLRSNTELMSTLAALMGSFRQRRADLYEKGLYKLVPELAYKTHKAGVQSASAEKLLALKANAARFVVAGAAVGVVWDAVDIGRAVTEDEKWLAAAYFGRAFAGGITIGTTFAGARFITAPLWLLRTNLVTAIATGVLSYAIGKLKGEEWSNWLQAEPFRKSDSTKIPHTSESEMMDKLADALAEMD